MDINIKNNYLSAETNDSNLSLNIGTSKIIPTMQEKTITPKKEIQEVLPDENFDALSKVTVNKIPDEYIIPELEDLRVTPIKEDVQVFQSEKDGYNIVVVNPIPDEYIIPVLQDDKVVTPTKSIQEVTADGLFDGMSKVTVNPIGDEYIIPNGNLDITENGDYNVTEYANVNVNVESGSGTIEKDIEWKDVVFIDFDGTPLYSYTMEEVQELTELPPLPTRKGFTYQGWNWTLEDIKKQVDGAIVGAHCVTSDGLTRLYLEVDEYTLSFKLGIWQTVANGFLIDWGDGTNEITGTKINGPLDIIHTYPKTGKYTITLTAQSNDVQIILTGSTTTGAYIIRHPILSSSWISNGGYSNILKKIEASEHLKILNNYGLFCCRGLETINIPKDITYGTSTVIRECCSLKSIVIPQGCGGVGAHGLYYNASMESISLPASVNAFGGYMCQGAGALKHIRSTIRASTFQSNCFRECYNLERFAIPNVASIPTYAFYNCYNLKKIKVPMSVNSVSSYAFQACYSLKEVIFEGDITKIGSYAFYRCMNVRLYDFRNCSSVPTLSATSAFTSIGDDTIMVVPDDLYDEWVDTTNWSNYAGYIVKESEYNA